MNDAFLSEEDLVCALKAHNPMALRVIYHRYAPTLLGVATTILKYEDCSGPILDDIFMAIWSSIDQYNPDRGHLLTWMYHIARKHALAIAYTQSLTYVNSRLTQGNP